MITIQNLWKEVGFNPNSEQERAILHTSGPLYLTAGPGSGKTRVLLWRTLNLIVFHQTPPERIFLGTFTEKAAHQLKEGLKALLGMATNHTNVHYDLAKMYVGTIHSLCQQIIRDKHLNPDFRKMKPVLLLDELDTYFFFAKRSNWTELLKAGGLDTLDDLSANQAINRFFNDNGGSRHAAITNLISLFSRFSEEMIVPEVHLPLADEALSPFLQMYHHYQTMLLAGEQNDLADFSLIQQKAYELVSTMPGANAYFHHVIVDEYQDTNLIQEKLIFKLAEGNKNVCVVGDDDQALYRFRGATVENFVEFPKRCQQYLSVAPEKIPLNTNYRSKQQIVGAYTQFIDQYDWQKEEVPGEYYRVHDKEIKANSKDEEVSVIASTAQRPEDACAEIARLVREIVDSGKVKDPNQIAFLYPALKGFNGAPNEQVHRMIRALEDEGLRVYAPRAGRFLDVDECRLFFGVLLHIFGRPARGEFNSTDYNNYFNWIDRCYREVRDLFAREKALEFYIEKKRAEVEEVVSDYSKLVDTCRHNNWELDDLYDPDKMRPAFSGTKGISAHCMKWATNKFLEDQARKRLRKGSDQRPFTVRDILTRFSSLDWTLLDLFYRLAAFPVFKEMYDLAESGEDEGPICNLGLISQYIAKFHDIYSQVLTANFLAEEKFRRSFFMSFIYPIYRRGESEFENADDPFPKGRIPFLTIHQSKGLEFPVVVLGNLRKDAKPAGPIERCIRQLVPKEGEPLERLSEFDIARMYYVALSRAENLLVLAHYRGPGQRINVQFNPILQDPIRIPQYDLDGLSDAKHNEDKSPKTYSYTADYLVYERCPRNYMVFRRYGLVPSRTQTQFFGSLVHQTIEDLHLELIRKTHETHPQ
ncbi:MAG: ATP-dependent helicase [Haliscomenobacteraceae bacterium CHB4]|nr:ATP-dependent DNA helicase Rep [Saprospiraceae bacterium]MCE7926523.1 ATP-dependent helicase [Haliscomenobacteraceae bacterium CHB4]